MYTTELSVREKGLGFLIGKMPNPKGKYMGEPAFVEAVLCEVDKDNVIVKVIHPLGGFRYSHQQRVGVTNEYRPVSQVEFDPETAILKAKEYLETM